LTVKTYAHTYLTVIHVQYISDHWIGNSKLTHG